MKTKLNSLVGKYVTVYAVAEGIAFSHLGKLVAPVGFSKAFSVGDAFTSITFQPCNVKNITRSEISLSILEPRTHKMVKKQTKQQTTKL